MKHRLHKSSEGCTNDTEDTQTKYRCARVKYMRAIRGYTKHCFAKLSSKTLDYNDTKAAEPVEEMIPVKNTQNEEEFLKFCNFTKI